MIHPDSRTLQWIRKVAEDNDIRDLILVEKTIRAFSLLEALSRSGCPFVFKGGSSLMLHLDSARRLSIDVDIICPPGTVIEEYLNVYSREYGFGDIELVQRVSRTGVPKQHAKFFYQVAYPAGGRNDKILLDVLFEDIHYSKVVELPLTSRFLKQQGDPIMVRLPSREDLLGDKLTAFAPHTTGIPFFKGEKSCSMEICKQLFDIASLFDVVSDMGISADTFRRFAAVELGYRGMDAADTESVLDDIYNTSVCLISRGQVNPGEYGLLQDGIKRVRGFIHSEVYSLESAIVNASKAAYLSELIRLGCNSINHYKPGDAALLAGIVLKEPVPTKFNKLKKTNIEAFFYWNEIQKLAAWR